MNDHVFIFEKLDVYQKALDLSHQVYGVTQKIRNQNNRNWCDQIERASSSIVLNLAEGAGRRFSKEKRSFYNIAQGSCFECVPLIELGCRLNFLEVNQKKVFREELTDIAKMLTRLIQSVEKDL